MTFFRPRPQHPRRGVTLVEMLVVVALLVLMMTIIVQIFSAATGAVSAAKVYQELDDQLRQLDGTIRQDLGGVTARLNPPLDPDENLGYFEYIENCWADAQGEDSDDCLRFTAQAPPNQPFTGRMYVVPSGFSNLQANVQTVIASLQPIMVTSQYAEIIYFLRNGNLYRRVFLVAPERQAAVDLAVASSGLPIGNSPVTGFVTGLIPGGAMVSWLGVNDLSAHPSPRSPASATLRPWMTPRLNTLGDLTNRENRAFAPRFSDDMNLDGVPDDINVNSNGAFVGDGVPDYYPTLYPSVLQAFFYNPALNINYNFNAPTLQQTVQNSVPISYHFFPFPYIYPGAYSQPDPLTRNSSINNNGWIHCLDPATAMTNSVNDKIHQNHSPLDVGDSLPTPSGAQTWWGFPTWHETTSRFWLDPVWQVNVNASQGQTFGLQPFNPTTPPAPGDPNLLPNLIGPPYPLQLFNDGAGTGSSFLNAYGATPTVWEDDLVMTGVRSFDVKAYDDTASSYVDLGYNANFVNGFGTLANGGFNVALQGLKSLGHEGLIPPRGPSIDYRYDPQAQAKGIFIDVGDQGSQIPIIRLRRTWDTWSTAYTEAPANGYDPNTLVPYGLGVYPPNSGQLADFIWPSNPVYPSYPARYPVPLRGLQIQLRVVDPRNERVKVLTIRQDFSDKIIKPQ